MIFTYDIRSTSNVLGKMENYGMDLRNNKFVSIHIETYLLIDILILSLLVFLKMMKKQ